jgi:hypothetical protein
MKAKCKCSFCEGELVEDCLEPDFCQPCEVVFVRCNKCGKSYSNKLNTCPECKVTNKE